MKSGATHGMITIFKLSRRLTVQKRKKKQLRTVRCIQRCLSFIGRTHLRCGLSQKRKIIYNMRATSIYNNNIHTFYNMRHEFFFGAVSTNEQTMNKKSTKQWQKPLVNERKA